MLGFSIQAPVFLGKPSKDSPNDLIAHFDRVEMFLDDLKANGVQSIEVRILPRHAEAASYQDLIQTIWNMGLKLTVHGHVAGNFSGHGFVEHYPSMQYVLKHFHKYQSGITMAIHAFDAKTGSEQELHQKTVELFRSWSSIVQAEQLPIRFAIENNRKKAIKVDPGDSIAGVIRMVDEIDSDYVGITWDMGHFYSNLLDVHGLRTLPEFHLEELPPAAFLERVYHTHIHGMGETGTHNPLAAIRSLPLEQYVSALQQHRYEGAYNLELTMNKFDQEQPLADYVRASVQRLKSAIA